MIQDSGEIFRVVSDYESAGDQADAIRQLKANLDRGIRHQTLLGVTGSGKTFTLAKLLESELNRPALVLSHNKTLAAQLYSEFKAFFPSNAVEYFISYYDYYLPESYIPQTDTYIAKDASINDNIERLRLSATASLLERRDTLVVASVSCIYGLTSPEDYDSMSLRLAAGDELDRDLFLHMLVAIQYERNDVAPERGQFRVRGDCVDVFLSQKEEFLRVEFWGDTIESISRRNLVTGAAIAQCRKALIFPARHFVLPQEKIDAAMNGILEEMRICVHNFEEQGKLVEAQRLFQRVNYDVEMMKEIGYCPGIENYSRHLSGRAPGSRPFCLVDFMPKDYLLFIDESHVTLPQLQAMYKADRSRKQTLVDYGFRLPSAMDNRPLTFEEFLGLTGDTVYVSATPGDYEMKMCGDAVVELVVRPTGLLDPPVEVRPLDSQIDDVIAEIRATAAAGARSLVVTLTKKSSERLADYLSDVGIRVKYLHSEIDAIERVKILNELRRGDFDCIVGINLIREGIDLPEIRLVAILDADKEGFLRSRRSLIQVAGRAARNADGKVILYADNMTDSMKALIETTEARRAKQNAYNAEHGIVPHTIIKPPRETIAEIIGASQPEKTSAPATSGSSRASAFHEPGAPYNTGLKTRPAKAKKGRGMKGHTITLSETEEILKQTGAASIDELVLELESQMLEAAEALEFERAAQLRDRIRSLSKDLDAPPF